MLSLIREQLIVSLTVQLTVVPTHFDQYVSFYKDSNRPSGFVGGQCEHSIKGVVNMGTLKNILVVKDRKRNLVSVSHLTREGSGDTFLYFV